MRLIDSDKLENDIVENITVKAVSRMLAITQGQPIVKAIPIEWLKKFANERAKNEDDEGYWHYWGTDLLQMIEQWEKENVDNQKD